ncbi:MAG: hypothetical protein ABJA82_00315 [Myxococcales bacterium]
MKRTLAFGISVMVALAWAASPAGAKDLAAARGGRLTLRPSTVLLADNVVVTPGSGSNAPAQQPAAQANVQTAPAPAAAPAPQQAAPVETSHTNKVVHTDVESNHNYMGTLAVSALMGGLVGVLVGGSIYFLGDRNNAQNIGYWAAGGVLLGTGVGVTQIVVQESRASNATALNKLPSDPAPTFRLALFRTSF